MLLLGSGFARLVGIAAIPALTRVFSPQELGVLALFTAFIMLLSPVATLRYETALPLPRNDSVAAALVLMAFVSTVAFSASLAVLILVFDNSFFEFAGISQLSSYGIMVVFGVVLAASFEILQAWSLRKKRTNLIARMQMVQAVAGAATKLSLGAFGWGAMGLIVGQMTQHGFGWVGHLRQLASDAKQSIFRPRTKRVIAAAKRYRAFPLVRLPSHFLLVLALKFPLIAAAVLFDAETVGYLSLAFSILALPVTILSQTVANAFYAEAAEIGSRKTCELRDITLHTMGALAAIATIPTTVILVGGDWLFELLLGPGWGPAGRMAQILSLYLFAQMVCSPVMNVLTVLELHSQFFMFGVLRLCLTAIAFAVAAVLQLDAFATVAAYSGSMCLYYAIMTIHVIRAVNRVG